MRAKLGSRKAMLTVSQRVGCRLAAMWARIKAMWHDPVWSKVIAGAILGVAAFIWAVRAVIASGVSGAADRAAAGLHACWRWLEVSAPVPQWLLLLMLVSIVQLVRVVRRHGKRLDNVEYGFRHHQMDRHVPPLPPVPPEPEPEHVAEGFKPTPGQRALIERGAGHSGRKVEFKDAQRVLRGIDPSATWDETVHALKTLKGAGAVKFFDDGLGNGCNGGLGYALTGAGHRYLRDLKESKRTI